MFRPISMFLEKDDGGGVQGVDEHAVTDWKQTLPEPIREWEEVKTADSAEKFWDQIANQRTFLGQSIRIPSDDAGAEDKKAFYEKLMKRAPELMLRPNTDDPNQMETVFQMLGRPADAGGYKKPDLEVPEGVQIDEEIVTSFAPIAHKYGLSQMQYQGIVKDMLSNQMTSAQASLASHQSGIEALKKEWGIAADKNFEVAVAVAEKTGAPKALLEGLKNRVINPEVTKWMRNLADMFGKEGASLIQDPGGKNNVLTPSEASERIQEILNNKEHAYWKADHPHHQSSLKKMVELQAAANPGASRDVNDLRRSSGA